MQLHLIFAYVFCQSPYTAHMVPLAIGIPLPEHRAKRVKYVNYKSVRTVNTPGGRSF